MPGRAIADIARLLLDRGAVVEPRESNDSSPLTAAALDGHTEVVKLLLEHSAAPNRPAQPGQPTPLLYACREGHASVVRALLGAQADVNLMSPLWTAVRGSLPTWWRLRRILTMTSVKCVAGVAFSCAAITVTRPTIRGAWAWTPYQKVTGCAPCVLRLQSTFLILPSLLR
jgi:hypothetical protein